MVAQPDEPDFNRISDHDHSNSCYTREFFTDENLVALKMRGIPFKTNVQDIEGFFRKFKVLKNSIKFGFDIDGRKSGEATILLKNHQEANKAKAELDGEYIGARYV